jgi:hypothetical protein
VKVKYKVKDKLILFYVNCIIPINEGQKLYVKGVLFITESQIKCCIVLVVVTPSLMDKTIKVYP